MEKTNEQLIEEFLANGGEIEVIPPVEPEESRMVRSTIKKVPEPMTLPEAEFMYGRKQVKKKKIKKPDFSNINMDLIPEHLREIIKAAGTTKEELLETNKNNRSTEASNKG